MLASLFTFEYVELSEVWLFSPKASERPKAAFILALDFYESGTIFPEKGQLQ